ncbi:type I-E CRISPR-associated protein Cas5/CasD [Falseniella ignava]|uniref:Type I-E CRISPR-associated protein Cas5/CasD n=1 Tax=Falseniella ignava TaxID=137730 RepID=A0A2I1JZ06_9LACT|nr:type I-E CRISPR-associated protein Cas5/CasD [Falseniella ignava]PKY88567.1 type I-E CRISPR-associated protein Cas5/CasD [Falseniella ignava]
MTTILLKLSGPLQSYGTDSHFETRHTDLYPSKSAIIGMIAASLGYRRNETQKIKKLNDLNFGVRVDQKGKILRDYHIAKKYKNNGNFDRTYVTNRYYIEDAIFLVALNHKDDRFITEIKDALLSPYFQPFLGRRTLPLTADFFQGIHDEDIPQILSRYPWQASDWYRKKYSSNLSVYLDAYLVPDQAVFIRKDRPESFNQKGRKFNYRYESYLNIKIENKYSEHDAFSALGGEGSVSI